jgi:HD-GYP domain-containing protein (c-di-GMP phosphodiesterase class II)
MAKETGMREKELQQLEYVVLLHDAGKIGVPEKILNKPAALSLKESIEVQKHSALSAEIINKINFLSDKSEIVRHHHERYDGDGYPDGLAGEAIPLASRIIAIADAYDAMITDRPFRPAKTPAEALEEIEALAGRQFDPALVKQFNTVLKRLGEF